jgi:Protein of unknown function (DUF3592)
MSSLFTPQAALVALAALCFVMAFWLFNMQRRQRNLAEASKQWPQIEGLVTASSVGRRINDVQTAAEVFVARVTYNYKVNGVEYNGSRVVWGGDYEGSERQVQEFVAANPAGKRVLIYYDRNDPQNAVLLRQPMRNISTLLLVSILLVVIGVGSLWLMFAML